MASTLVQLSSVSTRGRDRGATYSVYTPPEGSGSWFLARPSLRHAVVYDHTFAHIRAIPTAAKAHCSATAFCPATGRLAVADYSGAVSVWDGPKNRWKTQVAAFSVPGISHLTWANGLLVCINGTSLSVHSMETLPLRTPFPNRVRQVESLPYAPCFCTLSEDSTFAKIWYISGASYDFLYLPHPERVLSVSWKTTSAGRAGTYPGSNGLQQQQQQQQQKYYLLTNCEDNFARIWSITISDDGSLPKYILIANIEGYVHWMSYKLISDTLKFDNSATDPATPKNNYKDGLTNNNNDTQENNSQNNTTGRLTEMGLDAIKASQIRNLLKDYSDMVFTVSSTGDLSVWGIKYLEMVPVRETRTIMLMKFQNTVANQDIRMFDGKVSWLPSKGSEILLLANNLNGRMACWSMNLYDFFATKWATPKFRLLHQWCGPSHPPQTIYKHPYLPYILILDKSQGLSLWKLVNGKMFLLNNIPSFLKVNAAVWLDRTKPTFAILLSDATNGVRTNSNVAIMPLMFQFNPKTFIRVVTYDEGLKLFYEILDQPIKNGPRAGATMADFLFETSSYLTTTSGKTRQRYSIHYSPFREDSQLSTLSFDLDTQVLNKIELANLLEEQTIQDNGFTKSYMLSETSKKNNINLPEIAANLKYDTNEEKIPETVYMGKIWNPSSNWHGPVERSTASFVHVNNKAEISVYDLRPSTNSESPADTNPKYLYGKGNMFSNSPELQSMFKGFLDRGKVKFYGGTNTDRLIYLEESEPTEEDMEHSNGPKQPIPAKEKHGFPMSTIYGRTSDLKRMASTVVTTESEDGFVSGGTQPEEERKDMVFSLKIYTVSEQAEALVHRFINQDAPINVAWLSYSGSLIISVVFRKKMIILKGTTVPNSKRQFVVINAFSPTEEGAVFEYASLTTSSSNIPVVIASFSNGELKMYTFNIETHKEILGVGKDFYGNPEQQERDDFDQKEISVICNIIVNYLMYDKFDLVRKYYVILHNFLVLLKRFDVPLTIFPASIIPFLDIFQEYSSKVEKQLKNESVDSQTVYDTLFSGTGNFSMANKKDAKCINFEEFNNETIARIRDILRPQDENTEPEEYISTLSKEKDLTKVKPTNESFDQFINLSEAFVSLDQGRGSEFDHNAIRFLLQFQYYQGLVQSGKDIGIDQRSDIFSWAYFSESHSAILTSLSNKYLKEGKLLWKNLSQFGFGWWFCSIDLLKKTMETVARNEYMENKDPSACSLLYLAMKKKTVLYGLWKIASGHPEQESTLRFLANDFQLTRWSNAAVKNAFVLLGKQRYIYAAAFFILGDRLEDAVSVCLKQLRDPQLAIIICRLYAGDNADALKSVLMSILSDEAFENDPYIKCIASYQLKEYEDSLKALVGGSSHIGNESDPFRLLLYRHISEVLKLKKNPIGSSTTTVSLYSELEYATIGILSRTSCPILSAELLLNQLEQAKLERLFGFDYAAEANKDSRNTDNTTNNGGADRALSFDWSSPVSRLKSDPDEYKSGLFSGNEPAGGLFDLDEKRPSLNIDEEFEMFKKSMGIDASGSNETENVEDVLDEDDIDDTFEESAFKDEAKYDDLSSLTVALRNGSSTKTSIAAESYAIMSLKLVTHAVSNLGEAVAILSHNIKFLRVGANLVLENKAGRENTFYFKTFFTLIEHAISHLSSRMGVPISVVKAQLKY